MAYIKTPLLRPLRKSGATLYTFPSAAEDIALNINMRTEGVAMSHYALLNFNSSNFDFFPTDKAPISQIIPMSLQREMMNAEVALMNQPQYNFQESKTVTEHVFWNWVNLHSKIFKLNDDGTGYYRESNYQSNNDNRLVQCFGAIDAGNHLSTDFGMFNETYVNVPSSYGNGPVFFRSCESIGNYVKRHNYNLGTTLQGRESTDPCYFNDKSAMAPAWGDGNVYSDANAFEIIKDIPSIQRALNARIPGRTILISSYDDVNVDALGQFNNQGSNYTGYDMNNGECLFKYNALLLYYSIYSLDDLKKEPTATNLFGIVFLDGGKETYESGSTKWYISPHIKKKSFRGTGGDNSAYFGNALAFRVNVKTLSVYDNSDALIQDNTTTTSAYSQDFNDVISNLNKAIDTMNTNMQTTAAIQNSYAEMKAEFLRHEYDLEDLKTNIEQSFRDEINAVKSELKEYTDQQISYISDDLEYGYSEGNVTDGSEPYVSKEISRSAVKRLASRMQINSSDDTETFYGANISITGGNISDEIVDIQSDTNATIKAANIVNLAGKDINLEFNTGEGKTKSIPVSSILKRITELENALKTVKLEAKADKNDFELAKIIAMGIYPVNGILQARSKKPSEIGFYLKENTSGNIDKCVMFDGTGYKETIKCEPGKMYSVKGVIYAFNGETCKPIGS